MAARAVAEGMQPFRLLEHLCRRHGLSLAAGLYLEPLVERALSASGVRQRRLLRLIDGRLAQRAAGSRPRAWPGARQEDERLLEVVARLLHGWKTEPR